MLMLWLISVYTVVVLYLFVKIFLPVFTALQFTCVQSYHKTSTFDSFIC